MAQPANTMALLGSLFDANGNSPYENQLVTSAPATGYFSKGIANSIYFQDISITGPFPSGLITNGYWTIYLPWPSQTDTGGAPMIWEIFLPDGTAWAGPSQENAASNGLWDLSNAKQWNRVQVGPSLPVLVGTQGLKGDKGDPGKPGAPGAPGTPGAAGSGTALPTLQSAYGARGDGVTDDYQAIGNYLADLAIGRPTVSIPLANYYISKPFAVPMTTDRPTALSTTIKLAGVGNGGSTNGHYPISPSGRGTVFDFRADGTYNPYLNDYAMVSGGDFSYVAGAPGATTIALTPFKAFINNTTNTDQSSVTPIGPLTIPVVPDGWYSIDVSRDGHVYLGSSNDAGGGGSLLYWVKSTGGAGTTGSTRQLSTPGTPTGAAYCTVAGTRPDTIRLYELHMAGSKPDIIRDARCYLGCFNHRGNGTLSLQDICLAQLSGTAGTLPFIVSNGILKTQDVQFWGRTSANFQGNPGIPSQDAIHIGGSGSWYSPGGSDSYSNYSIMAGYGSRLRNDLAQNIRKYFWIRGNGQDVVVENPYLMGNCGNNRDGSISGIDLSGTLVAPPSGIHIVNPEFEMSSYAHAIRIGLALETQIISPIVSDANNGWLAANIAAGASTISVVSATMAYPMDITNWLGQEILLDSSLATEEVVMLAATPVTYGGGALPTVTGTAGNQYIDFATSVTIAAGVTVLLGSGQATQEVVQIGAGGTGTRFQLNYGLGYSYAAAPAGLGPWVLTFGATKNAFAHAVIVNGPTVARSISTVKYVTGEYGNGNLVVGGSRLFGNMRLVSDPTPAGTNSVLSNSAVSTRAVTVTAKAALGAAGPPPFQILDSAGVEIMHFGQRTVNNNPTIDRYIEVPYGQTLSLQAEAGYMYIGTDNSPHTLIYVNSGSGITGQNTGDANPTFYFKNFSATYASDLTQWKDSANGVQFAIGNVGTGAAPKWGLRVRAVANAESMAQSHALGSYTGRSVAVYDDAGVLVGWFPLYN